MVVAYLLFADGQFSVVGRVTETATGKVYRVYQSSQAAAQVLVSDTVLTQPVVQFTGTESADGLISVADRDSDGGTTIRVLIDGTGARVGDVLRLNYGGQDVDVTITAIPSDGYITVTVPTASLLAETPAGTSETVSMTAELMRSGASLIASNPASVDVNFIAPTAPTINNTAWAATGAGNTSDLSGIGEAKYATNSTTHATTGTADNALYVSETWDNGTVVRVQLPQAGTGIVPPAAGDTVLVNWGSETAAASITLTAAHITAKFVDITVPYSKLETQAFGNVTVTAQIKNAVGNLSATSPVATVNWAYDVAAGQLTANPQYGFAINGQLASDYAGWSISKAGDVNGDGYDDLVIGAPQNDTSGSNAGRAYVLFGNSTGAYSNFDLSTLTVAGNSNGFVINAPAIANAWYGWSVSGGGDINGDGLADVVIGNNTNYASTGGAIRPLDVNASGAGGPSYVVFGRSATTAVSLSTLSVASNTNGFMVSSPFANGYSVTDAGDVNGDGLSDLAISAPSYNGRAGVAYVVYGKTSGAPVVTASSNFVNSTEGFVINGGTVDGTVAALTSVSSGDINGDGLSDLVLGGWYTGTSTGSVYVVYGSSAIGARPMVDLSSLTSASNTLGFRIVGESSTGVSVAGAADINGDGLDDVLLQSTAGYAGTNTNQGVAWVAFGKKDGAAVNVSAIEAGTASGFAINLGITSGVHGAFWIDSAGDINGDGLGDIIVSHAYGNLSPTAAGAAYVVFGKTDTGMVNVASLTASDGFRILGACANDYLGMRVTGAGDVNGDGFDDIAVSAPYADPAGRTDAGMTYIVYGGASAYRSSVFQASNGDVIGTSGNDTLTGTSGNNQLVGDDGNDTLTGAGGADVMYGGRGDDVIVVNNSNIASLALTGTAQNMLRIDGGAGIDTLKIEGTGVTTNLAAANTLLDKIGDLERIDLGNQTNTLTMGLKNVLQMSNDNVFNTANGWSQTSTGWTQVSGSAPTAWGTTNRGNQVVVDGGSTDSVVVDGAFIQAGTVTYGGNTYKVLQSTSAQAQILVDSDIQLTLRPTIYAGLGELTGNLTEGEAISGGGTVVRVAIANIGAGEGHKIQLKFANSDVLSAALTSTDMSNGYVDILVPTDVWYANVLNDQVVGAPVPMSASLVSFDGNGAMSVLNAGPTEQQLVDFVSPTAPIIDATAWATTNTTSDTTGIPEAMYETNWAMATSATGTPPTTGSADGGVYVSEALTGGATVHVKLPNGTASSTLRPPVAGDKVLVAWGGAAPIEVVLSATDISNKYLNVNVPFSTIDAQGFGSVTVTAQIVSAATGNLSDAAKVGVNYLYELPLALISGGTQGFVINGSTSAGETGFSVASAGDVNGDGLEDVIIGARREDNNKGRAYVVFGKTDTTAIDLTAVLAGSGGFVISSLSKSDSYTGYDVYGAGDINGDGLADLLVSVPDFNSSASGPGDVFVVYGKADTAAVQLSTITGGQSTGFRISGVSATAQGQLGQSLAAAGDMNGDGIGDFIIGQPGQGKAYVVYGRQDNATINITAVEAGSGGYAITGLTGGSNYWDANVGAGGDVNGDGLADVVIGDGNLNNTNNRAFVVFGSTNNPGSFVGTAVGTRGFIIQGATATGSKLGDHVTIVDDFNGDGLADVVVSDEARRVYVVYGKTGNTTVALGATSVDATGAAGFTILTNDAADTVGSLMAKNVLVSSAGDFNGDGLTDLLIGVPTGDPYGRADAGRSYLVYGRTGGVSVSTGSMAFSDGFRIIGESAGDYSGFAISAAGDVNGDGFADLVMGAYGTDYGSQTFAGKSYVIFGGIDRVTKTAAIDFLGDATANALSGTTANEQFIAGAGNDTLTGGGGADVMYGGAGNDSLVLNASNVSALARNTGNDSQNVARIDGGTGLDKIVLSGSGMSLDLTAIRSEVIHNVEWLDVTGSGNNSVTLNLNNVVQMSNFNVYNTANGYAPVSAKEPAGWGAVNTDEQLLIDGNTGDAVTLKGAWYVSGQVAKAGVVYNVVQHVSATAQVLVHGGLDLHLQPAVDVGFGEIVGKLNLIEAQSDGKTVVRVYIAYTGAVDGNALSLDWDGQTVVQAITATDISKGYVDVAVSTATLLAATADGTSESIAVRADLLSAPTSGSLVVSGASAQVTVDFVRPTAPIIDATVWSSTNLTSDSTGIPEARYELLESATGASFPTSGTADGQLTTSEVTNGTVVRVQLPIGTGSAQPPVAGDTLVVGWGAFSKIIELTPAHITSKYVDVSLTATEVQSQPYGTVAVTAKLRSAATGNESNVAEVLVNYAFELPLGLVGNSVAGYAILGQTSLESGYHVAMLGDVNGDGLDDLLIGAPESTAPGGTGRSGQAYVVFGKTDNAAINLTAVAQGSGGFAIYGKSTGEFVGWDVSSVGDMNGDGLADLLVGATWNNGSGTYYAGRGYLIYGKSSGDAVYTSALGSQGFTIYGPAGPTSATRDNFANSVDMLGDVNGDGINDLGFFASNAGKAYVVYGKTDNSNILATAVEGGTGGFAMSGLASGIGFWGRIGGGGDINGDGYDDVVIGDAIFGSNDGRAFVVYGSSTGVNLAASSSLGTSGFVITGPTGQNFVMGMDVEILGDVNGDGLADVGVTAANRTAFVIYGGNSTNLTVSASAVDSSRGFAFSFNDPDKSAATYATNYYGQQLRLASIGDFNGDGLADFLVGYDKGDVYGTLDAGRGYVVYGRTSGQSISTSTMTASDGFRILGESASGYAGYGVAGGGDVNGDGFSDLVISAYGQFGTGTSGGKTYVVFGGLSGGTDPTQIDFMGTSAGETLNGTNTTSGLNEQFIGGAGDDTLVGGGGADAMFGGTGNDTFKLGADNVAKLDDAGTSQSIARIDGGTGLDKIVLDGSSITMDLTAIKADVIRDVEEIDITGVGANTLKLNLFDVLDMGSSNVFDVNAAAVDTRKQLMVTGSQTGGTGSMGDDTLVLSDLVNWSQSGTFTSADHTYDVWNHNSAQVQLLVDQKVTVSVS